MAVCPLLEDYSMRNFPSWDDILNICLMTALEGTSESSGLSCESDSAYALSSSMPHTTPTQFSISWWRGCVQIIIQCRLGWWGIHQIDFTLCSALLLGLYFWCQITKENDSKSNSDIPLPMPWLLSFCSNLRIVMSIVTHGNFRVQV